MVMKAFSYQTARDKIYNYFNPLARLGIRKYSFRLPFLVSVIICIISELYAKHIVHDPNSVGTYIIFVNVALILYFSFRDSIKGGYISIVITVAYYLYIIFDRHYEGSQFWVAVETTFWLAILYLILASIVGWLKQRIDILIEQEMIARYEAEARQAQLETILQQLPVGVLIVNRNDNKMIGNKHLEKIINRKVPSSLVLSDATEPITHPSTDKKIFPQNWPIAKALFKGEIITGEEIDILRKDKRKIHLSVNAAPIFNKNKEIIAAVSTLYDVTEAKQLEQRKDDFVNMASHELKTPITSMKLYIEMLLKWVEKYQDEKINKNLHSLRIQTERLQELVSDLLDVSRIQTGKLYFRKEKFDIVDLIEETVSILQGATNKHTLVFSKKESIFIFADKFRIYQVLTNLVTNAIKYSPENNEIIIRIKKQHLKVVVSVEDFGIGIEKNQQRKIFERLYQVSDLKTKMYPGLGMGLYISKEIIRRHKGSIWVEGEKGKGSTFFFSLPIKK